MFTLAVSAAPIWMVLGALLVLLGWLFFKARSIPGNAGDFFTGHHPLESGGLLAGMIGAALTGLAIPHAVTLSSQQGISVFGTLSIAGGLVGTAVMFLVGLKFWTLCRRGNHLTQAQFFAARFGSRKLGGAVAVLFSLLLLPCLVAALAAAGHFLAKLTGISPWIPGLFIAITAAASVWMGGMRAASRFTLICAVALLAAGLLATLYTAHRISRDVAKKEGKAWSVAANIKHATELTGDQPRARGLLVMGVHPENAKQFAAEQKAHTEAEVELANKKAEWQLGGKKGPEPTLPSEPTAPTDTVTHLQFLSALFLPLALGVLPQMFLFWMGARSPDTFRRALIVHPIALAILWLPCVLLGIWAAGTLAARNVATTPDVLAALLGQLSSSLLLTGIFAVLTVAGACVCVVPMLMSLGTVITQDLVLAMSGRAFPSDTEKIDTARWVTTAVALLACVAAALLADSGRLATLGVWCVSGFAALFPIVFAALYWPRATAAGVGAAMAAAMVVGVLLLLRAADGAATSPTFFGMLPVLPMFAASTAVLLLVSRFTARPADEILRRYFVGNLPQEQQPQNHLQQQPQQSQNPQRSQQSQQGSRDSRNNPRPYAQQRPQQDSRDSRDQRDPRDSRDQRDPRDQRDSRNNPQRQSGQQRPQQDQRQRYASQRPDRPAAQPSGNPSPTPQASTPRLPRQDDPVRQERPSTPNDSSSSQSNDNR